jgi:hypothetical protein
LLELLELLQLLLLLLLLDVELVPLVDDTRLEVPVELDVLFSGIVVDPLTITSVVSSRTVVSPDIENLESTGIVMGPLITNSVVPSIRVTEPGRPVICAPGWATVVGPGMTRKGVPSTVVVIPGIPDARNRGILVADGKIRTGVPSIIKVMAPAMFVGGVIDVAEGITRKGVPSRMVVEAPVSPGIPVARDRGIFVADGKTNSGVPFIFVVIAPGIFGAEVGIGIVVVDGITMKGVPLIMVVDAPLSPGGAFRTGTWVAPGMTRNGVPLMSVVVPTARLPGPVGGAGILVALGTTRKGTPSMVAVAPTSPDGASERGILVGPGKTNIGVPSMIVVLRISAVPPTGCTTGIFVDWGTTMKGVLLMIVKLPVRPGGALGIWMLVEPCITTKGVPPMKVVIPEKAAASGPWTDGAAKVVGPVTAKNGVLLITVVGPVSPEGAFTTGILVAEGITMNGVPEIMVALAPGMISGGRADEAMKLIGEDTIITGIPSISDVFPGSPNGAADAGMVVGLGMTILTPDGEGTMLTGGSIVGQLPMNRQMA